MTTHQVTACESCSDDEFSIQPQGAPTAPSEDAKGLAVPQEPQSADGIDTHQELRAKVKEKNARTKARGRLQGGSP